MSVRKEELVGAVPIDLFGRGARDAGGALERSVGAKSNGNGSRGPSSIRIKEAPMSPIVVKSDSLVESGDEADKVQSPQFQFGSSPAAMSPCKLPSDDSSGTNFSTN